MENEIKISGLNTVIGTGSDHLHSIGVPDDPAEPLPLPYCTYSVVCDDLPSGPNSPISNPSFAVNTAGWIDQLAEQGAELPTGPITPTSFPLPPGD